MGEVSIDVVLHEARHAYAAIHYGDYPDTVYIGRKQERRLLEWLHEVGHLFALAVPMDRTEFAGMAVFVVDADDHLHCARLDTSK